jgi:hypothetical protein
MLQFFVCLLIGVVLSQEPTMGTWVPMPTDTLAPTGVPSDPPLDSDPEILVPIPLNAALTAPPVTPAPTPQELCSKFESGITVNDFNGHQAPLCL